MATLDEQIEITLKQRALYRLQLNECSKRLRALRMRKHRYLTSPSKPAAERDAPQSTFESILTSLQSGQSS